MADTQTITLPNVGDFSDIEIIEVLVAPGDEIAVDDALIMLESDKATMEIPSPFAGKIDSVVVNVGDKVNEGDQIATIVSGDAPAAEAASVEAPAAAPAEPAPAPAAASGGSETICLPNVGDFSDIEVIEVLVSAGDEIAVDDALIMLESDKATMEIPSPLAGKIEGVTVKVGDRVNEGDELATILSSGGSAPAAPPSEAAPAPQATAPAAAPAAAPDTGLTPPPSGSQKPTPADLAQAPHISSHASPAIRRFARELGVDLSRVKGSAAKGRVTREDVKAYVKQAMQSGGGESAGGISVPAAPQIDFSKFGEIEEQPLSRIKKISGAHLHRAWVTVPHVTQFDEAEITELEAFRKSLAKEAERKGVKITPLIFLMKAVVAALKEYPNFNASLDASGENLILKKYFHIGIAVDTPNGLVVPVIRDVDQKGVYDLAAELGDVSVRARDGKLSPADMQGGCFSISSLGGIGGSNFTPIVNAPEVAILGVSRSKMQPVYQPDGSFRAGLMLPLALSYDHRVIDGAQAARFTSFLSSAISDIRRVLL